jgi:hypothetical protein
MGANRKTEGERVEEQWEKGCSGEMACIYVEYANSVRSGGRQFCQYTLPASIE